MKREIKFRIWDSENSDGATMHYTDSLKAFENCVCADINFKPPYYNNSDGTIMMQFIGRIDKNGKDIYEGDIVRWDDNSKGKYWRVAKVVIDPDIQLVIVKNSLHEISTMFPWTFHWGSFIYTGNRQLEVIGNIYENPEILNPQTPNQCPNASPPKSNSL